MPIYPDTIAHADWSKNPTKRWVCIARRYEYTSPEFVRYRLSAPQRVGDLSSYFDGLCDYSSDQSALAGFDFPIGLPAAYADQAGIRRFCDVLPKLGVGEWIDFYNLCENAAEISLRRPFYPKRPGGTRQSHLFSALNAPSIDALRRRCEGKTAQRNAACSLFWTLGGQQVGRASISGWRDLIAPAMRESKLEIRLWPFDGLLNELVRPGRLVIAETYPAEAGLHIGLPASGRGWSKRLQTDRTQRATRMLSWAEKRGVVLDPNLASQINSGFGASSSGEDLFDATVGAMGMLEVVLGHRPEMPDLDDEVRQIEGWIFGQA